MTTFANNLIIIVRKIFKEAPHIKTSLRGTGKCAVCKDFKNDAIWLKEKCGNWYEFPLYRSPVGLPSLEHLLDHVHAQHKRNFTEKFQRYVKLSRHVKLRGNNVSTDGIFSNQIFCKTVCTNKF